MGKIPRQVRRTPKVFQTNYRPPRTINWSEYRRLLPLLWILGLILIIFLIGRLPAFRATSIETSGTDNKEIINAIHNLKGRSLFSAQLSEQINQIRLNHPLIDTLDCRRGIPGTLRCHVALRQGALTWKTGANQYLIDNHGFAYATAPAGSIGPLVEDRAGAQVKIGQAVIASQTVTNFKELANLLQKNHLQFSQFYIVDTLYQCGVVLTGSSDSNIPFAKKSPISVLLTFERPLTGQVASLVQILKDKHDQITDHVDLRVANYAYIK